MVNKMPIIAKFSKKNKKFDKKSSTAKSFKKISSFLHKGYIIKVDEKSYLLFEKEEHYLILVYLERIFFDLFKNITFEKEEKEIRVFFRMTLIQKCLENLQEILFGSFYNKNESKNSFKIKFPHLWYMKNFNYASVHEYNIMKDLNKWEDLNEIRDLLFSDVYFECGENYYLNSCDDEKYLEESEVSDEMKTLNDLEKRRCKIFNDKMLDLVEKINDVINIKSFKIKL